MTLLGKVYLGIFGVLLVIGVVWASMTLQSNAAWVEIVLVVPGADPIEPLSRVRYEVNLAALMAGWVVAVAILGLMAMRAPFKIRGAALTQKRIRDLEREVKSLRTLPLRQQDFDDELAADAQLDVPMRKVMTEQFRRPEGTGRDEPRGRGETVAARREGLRR